MTKRDLISAALVVYGLILVATAIGYSPLHVELAYGAAKGTAHGILPARAWVFTSICTILAPLVVGLVLVWKSAAISRLVSPEEGPVSAFDFKRDARWLLAVALTVLGIYFIVMAVDGFARQVATAYMHNAYLAVEQGESAWDYKDVILQDLWVTWRASIVEFILRLLIGGVLALKASAIARFLFRDRQLEPLPPADS